MHAAMKGRALDPSGTTTRHSALQVTGADPVPVVKHTVINVGHRDNVSGLEGFNVLHDDCGPILPAFSSVRHCLYPHSAIIRDHFRN